jgi:AcrR family transcriptional regulator
MVPKASIEPRKIPVQARSRRMRQDILQAGIRVLQTEGPLRFTTQRVAEVAGISVGSLYQYFPNKAAIVFAIRSDMIENGWVVTRRVLEDCELSAREKVHRLGNMYFLATARESTEAGAARWGAEVYFPHDKYRDLTARIYEGFVQLLRDAARDGQRKAVDAKFGADLLLTTLEQVGQRVAKRNLSRTELERWAANVADMLCDHVGLR